MSKYFRLKFFLVAFCCLMMNALYAEVEKAAVERGGKRIGSVSKAVCNSTGKAIFLFPSKFNASEINAYRMFQKGVTAKTCKDSPPTSLTLKNITVSNLKAEFEEKTLLSDTMCGESFNDNGVVTWCIYDAGDDSLVASTSYTFNFTSSKITEITNKNVGNNKVSFMIISDGGANYSQVCLGRVEAEQDFTDQTGNHFKDSNACYNAPEEPFELIDKADARKVTITNLTNDVEYYFKVRLVTDDGQGPWSETFTLTPIELGLPLDEYDGGGSPVQWSCTQSSKGGLLILSLLGIFLLALRNRRKIFSLNILPILLLGAICFHTSDVQARVGQINFGILGSPYQPDLDSELKEDGSKIFPFYKCFFRRSLDKDDGPINPFMGFEVDFNLLDDGLGKLQLGLGFSYAYKEGYALGFSTIGGVKQVDCNKRLENAPLSLHMYQFRPQITYILDQFSETFPIVPYIRGAIIGHGYSFTTSQEPADEAAKPGGLVVKPNGMVFGFQAAAGLMLMLDFLEPSAVVSGREQGFLNHVFLKSELSYTKIDNFGRRGFQFSPKDIMKTSLPLLWTFGLVFEIP